jgi:hypothetical protein
MNPNTHRSLRNRLVAALAGLGLFLAVASTGQANSSYYSYTLDTSAYAGTSGYLAFDLIGGDMIANDNIVHVTNLSTDGSMTDSSDFTMTDSAFFNEVLRDIVLGTTLSFNFALSENFVGGSPDSFAFYILDGATLFPLFPTSDPLFTDAIFAIDLTAQGPVVGVYAGSLSVPDQGSTLALSGLALGLLVFARKQGLRRAAA